MKIEIGKTYKYVSPEPELEPELHGQPVTVTKTDDHRVPWPIRGTFPNGFSGLFTEDELVPLDKTD